MSLLRKALGEDFYIVWFQEPGVAERALERDVRRTLTATEAWTAAWGEGDDRPPLPAWLTEEDLQVYVDAFDAHRLQRRAQLLPQHRPKLGAERDIWRAAHRAAGAVHHRLA